MESDSAASQSPVPSPRSPRIPRIPRNRTKEQQQEQQQRGDVDVMEQKPLSPTPGQQEQRKQSPKWKNASLIARLTGEEKGSREDDRGGDDGNDDDDDDDTDYEPSETNL